MSPGRASEDLQPLKRRDGQRLRGRLTDDVREPATCCLRRWPVKGFENWLIFYQVRREGGEIVHVMHGAVTSKSVRGYNEKSDFYAGALIKSPMHSVSEKPCSHQPKVSIHSEADTSINTGRLPDTPSRTVAPLQIALRFQGAGVWLGALILQVQPDVTLERARSGDRAGASRSCVCLGERNAETGLAPPLHGLTLRGSVSVPPFTTGFGQVGVRFTGVALQSGKSDDLAFAVDGACGLQVQSGVLRNQSVHVDCGSVAP